MATSCRISGQLRGWDLGFYSTCCFVASSYSALKLSDNRCQRARFSSTVAALHVGSSPVKSSGEAPVISDCFSLQQGDDPELPPEGLESVSGGVVALGKFDALHIGHRELAIQASKIGIPFLLSFVGMAEVLGWEPRDPIVAKCDRKRVLSSWAPYCGNMFPNEFCVKFSSVRHLTPQQFVEKLSRELRVRGVVAGENYRFGYKAAGDASELVRLCDENGIEAFIVPSVMDKNQLPGVQASNNAKERGQVSSTRVRQALAVGDMKYVSELLGRKHRVMLALTEEGFNIYGTKISILRSCSLNLLPKEGLYQYCSCFINNTALEGPCKVIVESKYIHVERHDAGDWAHAPFQDCRLIGIEFGDSREIC